MKKKFLVGALVVCVLVVGGLGWFAWSLNDRVEGQYFDSNGVRIHYTVEGTGVPVVLVHGFCANADMNWRHPGITERLAQEFQVIALDNRGHGLSDKPRDPAQYGPEMVRDIIRLLDHLEIEKAHIIGYSMGGYITMKLLTLYPERVITAAPCGAGWPRVTEERTALLTELSASLETGAGITPLMRVLDPTGDLNPMRAWFVNTTVNATNDSLALAALIRGVPGLSITEAELRAIGVPVLSIVGDIDPLREDVDVMEGMIAGHEVIFVPNGDHLNTVASPEMIEGLVDFLHKHAPDKAPAPATPAPVPALVS
jgi:pimeloyl-ACP methyl ester carboxylesterase